MLPLRSGGTVGGLAGINQEKERDCEVLRSELKDFDFQKVRYKAKSAYWLFTMKFEDR